MLFLRDPAMARNMSLVQWDLLIRQARRSKTLATVYHRLNDADLLSFVPARPLSHLLINAKVATRHIESIQWEVSCINEVLRGINQPLVLLKGAAYALGKLNASKGRLFSDVDIIVAKADLAVVEEALSLAGWESEKLDAYDQQYYRKWMHELPPMVHNKRGTTIDVHHNILPDTVSCAPDASLLLQAIRKIPSEKNIYTLSVVDRILHSATHLFYEGELEHGLRDLVDLDALISDAAGQEPTFWEELIVRAKQLNLMLPTYYALHYLKVLLNVPIPNKEYREIARYKPRFPMLMDLLFSRALMPDHASCNDSFTSAARWLLYIRSHYLRMPFYLLIPHLVRKACKRQSVNEIQQAADVGK